MVLLDIGLPVTGWLSIAVAAFVALLAFLLRNTFTRMVKDISDLGKRIDHLECELDIAKNDLVSERRRSDTEMRAIDNKINDFRSNVIDRLENIKDKFIEIRKS